MRAPLAVILLAALAGSAAPAASRQDPLDRELGGRIAGTPVDCVDNSRLMGPQVIDDRTILYRESGLRTWRNDLPESCPGLRPNTVLIVNVYGSQLCRNDRVRTIDPGSIIPGPTCRLGKFTPYDKPRKK
ncbi:MAG: hypothetical protein J0I47_00860 [Sphingomonas sp.]|uniref:DUF6491 family protein n=1 Tax=Sphingomonas sp. TaxID=28214 RepID=UPI001ACF2A13|nr:DUF6491 family protein [Sphingomonas sp.]MBN8806779.1 hypothetical protein [Sphingomonas sp.]